MIRIKALLLFWLSIVTSPLFAEVKVTAVPGVNGNDFDFTENFLRFYNDDSYITRTSLIEDGQLKPPYQLHSSIDKATILDRNDSGAILGYVNELYQTETVSIFVWSPTSELREILRMPRPQSQFNDLDIVGGGIDALENAKIIVTRRTPPTATYVVSNVGESVKEITLEPGLGLFPCTAPNCPTAYSYQVLGLGRDNNLWIRVSAGFSNPGDISRQVAGLLDTGAPFLAPPDFTTGINEQLIFTTDRNISQLKFTDRKANLLLTADNTVEELSSPRINVSSILRINDVSENVGEVGDYTQESPRWQKWGYFLKTDGKKIERIECKIKPGFFKNMTLYSALKINGKGSILATFRKVGSNFLSQRTGLIQNYLTTNANYCSKATISVDPNCRKLFTESAGGHLTANFQYRGKLKKCSFAITTKVGSNLVTDGVYRLTASNGKESLIRNCSKGVCRFSLPLNSDDLRLFRVTGPENSRMARNTNQFSIFLPWITK